MKPVYKSIISLFATAAFGVALTSCIENDIPYPRIQVDFTSFEVEGANAATSIDVSNHRVVVSLSEEVNIHAVEVKSYTLDPADASVVGDVLDAPLDLSTDQEVTLRLYQDYQWTISARQTINRYFSVEGQIGVSEIDPASHRVIAYIPDTEPLSAVKVLTAKLGAVGSTITPAIEGATLDFTNPVEVTVKSYGYDTKWTIYVEQTKANVTTLGVDAWTCVAFVHGMAREGKHNGVAYRQVGSSDWIDVPADWITHDGGAFTARIIHLQPATTYEARAYSDLEYGAAITFTTGVELQMPNSSFDHWWLDGKLWCPWAKDGERYWDTGNKGATTIGQSNSVPTDYTSTGTGQGAMLQSKFIGVFGVGKLAAGNIFTGEYLRTENLNGVLSFGREFSQRPTSLTCHLQYTPAVISHASKEFEYMKGQPDTCQVWIALIDTPQPFEIRTSPADRHLFDPNGDYVVAYGYFQSAEAMSDYREVTVPLVYTSTSRVPTYIITVASASKYGDFFTGGNGSVLYIDDLKLNYDY